MRKPKIKFLDGKWQLKWWYQPRSFTLFGATEESRERVYEYSFSEELFDSFEEARNYLKILYKDGVVRIR